MYKTDSKAGDGEMTIAKKSKDKLYFYVQSGNGINPDFDPVIKIGCTWRLQVYKIRRNHD